MENAGAEEPPGAPTEGGDAPDSEAAAPGAADGAPENGRTPRRGLFVGSRVSSPLGAGLSGGAGGEALSASILRPSG
jgi:hypothetical protein